ncbi:MAG: sensor histidine kinase [Anaerolineae bacterium]
MAQETSPGDYRNLPGQLGRQIGAARSRAVHRFDDFFARVNLSIRAKILIAFGIIILLMGLINAALFVQMSSYTRQYDAIIYNITTANSINGYIKPAIDTEMWNIVAGKTEFTSGKQYEIIDGVNTQVQSMMANTDSTEAKKRLEIIQRTLKTLTHYVDVMGAQIAHKSKVADNEKVLEDIRSVSSVVQDVVQSYSLFEVTRAETQYREMQANFTRWQFFFFALTLSAVAFAFGAAWAISRSIYIPIKKLHDVTTTITKNDLQALMTRDNMDEITELGMSFNIMIGRIRDLLDAKVKEQENLKKAELRALQAQINPHFLYNTLDTIIWMAEANKTAEVVEIVGALSSFFRLSLSKGRDWITIGEEIERTRSYLTIQKMRYRDIMNFRIEMAPAVQGNTLLKLILQPLVENALYHGIKNKRQGGTITVRAQRKNEGEVLLEVADDGIGFTPEKLAQIQAQINDDSDEIRWERGFGIDNVNKRIKLYYGKPYGLSIRSEYNIGTCVSVVIPAQEGDTFLEGAHKERVL